MTTMQTPRLLGNLWKSVLAWGVLTFCAGVLVLAWPAISVDVAAILFGAYLLVSGIAQIVVAFSIHQSASGRVLWFISGALSLVLGVLAFRHLDQGYPILFLAIWIGVGFIFQGVAETAVAMSYSDLPDRGWHVFLGVISVIAGMVVLASPFASILILAIVTGAWLIVIGITQVVWALRARRAINHTGHRLEGLTSHAAA
ncbi:MULTISPECIES: HdeD family acid-resistance protein [unclassified Mycolicibacterium]|uniref:HdeD family acid-resistance protein n=1 Tax=unclassified Mycolicibacterium TaxID=2636767 RepID=UPI002EDB1E8A